jgi:hypothetical protein
MAKALIQGYIVVTPDTPLVRSLIEPLNAPFRYANLLRDLAVDLESLSMSLQDAAARSEMNIFTNVRKCDFFVSHTFFRLLPNSFSNLV